MIATSPSGARRAALILAFACAAPVAGQAPASFPTEPPTPGPAPALDLPDPIRRSLPNGLEVVYVRMPELPIVHATLVTRGGTADAPADKPELASFTADLMDEGAGAYDALGLANALELLGASLFVGAGFDAVQVDLEVLRPRFEPALQLMSDVVLRPSFPEAEVERIKQQRLTDLQRAKDEARIIASNAFTSLVYGAEHPYGRLATTETTGAITRNDLVAFHRQWYVPRGATLVLAGDVDPAEMQPVVERVFGAWQGTPVPPPVVPNEPQVGNTRIYLVDKPGAAQSEIRIGHPGVARDHPDYFPLLVMNTILGGSFTSRLNMNLRETHGYSYGASSGYSFRRGAGPFTASSAVVTEKTDSSVIEFFRELRHIRDERVSDDDLARAKNYVALGLPRRFETVGGVAGQLADLIAYGRDMSFYESFVPNVMAVTAADVQRVAHEYVRPDRAVVVVVGDRARIEAGLRAIGIAPVELRDAADFVR